MTAQQDKTAKSEHWISYLVGIIIVAITAAAIHQLIPTSADKPASDTTISKSEGKEITSENILQLVNLERQKASVAPLAILDTAVKSAEFKANDMTTRDYLAHEDPETGELNGLNKMKELGAPCTYISENLAWAQSEGAYAEDILDWWMKSEKHRNAMLNPDYSLTGIGVSKGKKTVVVQHFCKQ